MKGFTKILFSVMLAVILTTFVSACGSAEQPAPSVPSVVATPSVSIPSVSPSVTPPSAFPSVLPTAQPSVLPSALPSVLVSGSPSVSPTVSPTVSTPSVSPTVSTPSVSPAPSIAPSVLPTATPTLKPTALPSVLPTVTVYENTFVVSGETITGLTAYGKTLSQITLPSVAFGRAITRIGLEAFYGCNALTTVTVPSGITHIGKYAFGNCKFLQQVEFAKDSALTYVGDSAFYGCERLTDISLPSALTQVEYAAFKGCASLTNITLPENVTYVGDYAFNQCPALTLYCAVANPPNGWGRNWNAGEQPVVWNCTRRNIASDGYEYAVIHGLRYALNNGNATLVRQPLNLAPSVEIPPSVTYRETVYPVTEIAEFAFAENTDIAQVTIPSSVIRVGENAFYRCFALTVYCQAESKPLSWCENWNYTDCPVVWNCNQNATATDGCVYALHNGFRYILKNGEAILIAQVKNLVGDIVIPNAITLGENRYSVTGIRAFAFENCVWIRTVTLPTTIAQMGDSVFFGCRDITVRCKGEGKPEPWHSDWDRMGENQRASVIWNS